MFHSRLMVRFLNIFKSLLLICLFIIIGSEFVSAQGYNTLVITEIMADPTPVARLPNAEYLELFNRSGKIISVKGWKLVTGSRSVILPDSIIGVNAFAVVCIANNVPSLSVYGKTIGVNALSLTNAGMSLALYNERNQLVFSISYLNQWWASDKRNGGFSLEMIDVNNPCGEMDNWSVSMDERGGTPGRKNSVDKENTDLLPPVVERVNILQSGELVVVFNERIDSANAVSGAVITLSGRNIVKRQLDVPSFRNLKLTLDSPLSNGNEYELNIRNISDCSGNLLRNSRHVVALPSAADSGDIVINEILFNPMPGGTDFVELYNKSAKYISLKGWTLSNIRDGVPDFSALITADDIIFPPFSCLALTLRQAILKEQYPTDRVRHFLDMPSFPAYSDTDGGALLRNEKLQIFDKLIYSDKMHHALISDAEGVSLERIDANKPATDWANWQSASFTTGYASPGYANAQKLPEKPEDFFAVEPEAFSPDNDGIDDHAVISFSQSAAGRIATLRIYSSSGNLVKNLTSNQLIGTTGDILWDGTDEQNKEVNTGYYLLLIDIFDISGKVQQYKRRIVVARKDR